MLLNSKDKYQDMSYMETHTYFLYMVKTCANREWVLPKALDTPLSYQKCPRCTLLHVISMQ